MKTKYEDIHFVKVADNANNPETSVWSCLNNKNSLDLGTVMWHDRWRQYCFFPRSYMAFSMRHLVDIQNFIKQLMEERKP